MGVGASAVQYEVVYRKGANNVVADAISRVENAPIVPVEVQPLV
jgi:hypothetical protein